MSGLSYFHDVWKDSAGRISFQKFEEKFDELYKESLNIEDLIFLLFTASRLFSQKRNGGDSFRTPQDWYNARAYFCEKMRICGEQLQMADANSFKPESLVLLIKAYNMMQIHPSLEMQNLLVKRSQDVFKQISFSDLRYMLRNFVGIDVYPGDAWVNSWHKAAFVTNTVSDEDITREDLLDILYYMTVMDYMRTARGRNQEQSPCQAIAMEMLGAFQGNNMSGKLVDSAIFYPAKYYRQDFVEGAKLDSCPSRSLRQNGWFQQIMAVRGYSFAQVELAGFTGQLATVFQNSARTPFMCRLDGNESLVTDVTNNTVHYAPHIRFKAEVHRMLGPEVITLSIPYAFLCRVVGLSTDRLMDKLLEGVDRVGPGHYVLHPDGLRPAQDQEAWKFSIP